MRPLRGISVGVIIGISVVGGISAILIILVISLVCALCKAKGAKLSLKEQQQQNLQTIDRLGTEMVSIANSISTENNVAYAQTVNVDNNYDTIPPGDTL